MLIDLSAERAVIAGCASNSDAFLDVDYFLQSTTFTDTVNQILWTCIKALREADINVKIDHLLLRSKAKELGFDRVIENPSELKYVEHLLGFKIEPDNVRHYAAIIRKLEVGRLLYNKLGIAQEKVGNINGNENIDAIIALAENELFDFSSLLIENQNGGITHISDGAEEYFQYLLDNEASDIIGIPMGLPIWDGMLGGGRRKSVNVVAARTGEGKSMLADNVCLHVAGKLGIPVLYCDTEMALDGHWHRIWANISSVPIKEIESGKFKHNPEKVKKVKDAVDHINGIPYSYVNISGKPFEETLAYIRRWLVKTVGYDENGRIKDCLVVYDYLKMMSGEGISGEMKEFQILGFQMTGLHNFAVKFDIPILSFVQINRDGINKESTEVISQSDRIGWLASSVTIYKRKSDDEVAASAELGTRKLVVVKNRYGEVNNNNEFINIQFDGSVARIIEGPLSTFMPQPTKPRKKKTEEDDSDDGQPRRKNLRPKAEYTF